MGSIAHSKILPAKYIASKRASNYFSRLYQFYFRNILRCFKYSKLFSNLNRDISLKQTTVNRLEELQNELKLESKQRLENEVEVRTSVEATNTKMKMYCDESVEAARQITAVIKKRHL